MRRRLARLLLCGLGLFVLGGALSAQIAMPDPKEMSGIPRPDAAVPNQSLTVRVIRGSLSNNVVNQTVELQVGDQVRTAKTDDQGRAQFDRLPAGASLKATTVVDGERIESQSFAAPAQGGVRLMLVATDKEKEAREAAARSAPAVSGQVVLGMREATATRPAAQSRIVIEPGDEIVDVFYFLDIVNDASTPVQTPSLFTFDMPTGATAVTLFQESQKVAAVTGTHVRVPGPFPPGVTSVQVVCQLPVTSGTLDIVQTFPASWEQVLVLVKKFGAVQLTSPQIFRQQDFPTGDAFMAGGAALAAGQPLTLTLSGLPHHSRTPRWIAVAIAGLIALLGFWLARKGPAPTLLQDERKRLLSRREKLLQELVRLENDERAGRGDRARYAMRREELMVALERIYGALDTDDSGPDPLSDDRAGVAA